MTDIYDQLQSAAALDSHVQLIINDTRRTARRRLPRLMIHAARKRQHAYFSYAVGSSTPGSQQTSPRARQEARYLASKVFTDAHGLLYSCRFEQRPQQLETSGNGFALLCSSEPFLFDGEHMLRTYLGHAVSELRIYNVAAAARVVDRFWRMCGSITSEPGERDKMMDWAHNERLYLARRPMLLEAAEVPLRPQ